MSWFVYMLLSSNWFSEYILISVCWGLTSNVIFVLYVFAVCFSFWCWLVYLVIALLYLLTSSLLFISLALFGLVKTCHVLWTLCLSLFLLCSWIVFVDLVAFACWSFVLLEFWSFGVLFCILRHACHNIESLPTGLYNWTITLFSKWFLKRYVERGWEEKN